MNIIAPINRLGYGITGLNITNSMSKVGDTALFPIGDRIEVCEPSYYDAIKKAYDKGLGLFNPNDPCLRIFHQNNLANYIGNGPKIGFPIFELDRFTDVEKLHLNIPDLLLVCSEWAKEIVGAVRSSEVVPLGVNRDIFHESDLKDGPTIFLNIGKWEIRKGHDILLQAFRKAFQTTDNAQLWMMCHNPFCTEAEHKEWHDLYLNRLGPQVRFLPPVQTCAEVANVMRQATCGVFPARAEGWNLELLEMMSCGRQVIATNYAGHTEFCNSDNCHLIEVGGLESAYDGKWFFGQGEWAELGNSQIDQLVSHFRHVYNNRTKINKEGIKTAKKFTWDNTVKTIGDLL